MASISEAFSTAVEHHRAGRLQEAERIYRRIVAADPHHFHAIQKLGVIAFQMGMHEIAVQHISRAIELHGSDFTFHINLGHAFNALGQLDRAIDSFRRVLELKPDHVATHSDLGNALLDRGNLDEAVASYRLAVELKPDSAAAHAYLGNALREQRKLNDAIHALHRALELNPDLVIAHYHLGNALKDQGKLDEAIQSYRRTLELRPDFAEAHNNLGVAFKALGNQDEAVASYRRALKLRPDYAVASSNLLAAIPYRAGVTLPELSAAHAEYERLQAAPLRTSWRAHWNEPNPLRKLRIGFISPDFGRHPVGYFSIGALENLDPAQCETVCYSDRTRKDDLTARFEAAASVWRDAKSLNDSELAEQIRADRIDILFDLAGHTARNRLLVFARKPAPIQVTWAGYAGTTGLRAIDYILADGYEIPPAAEAHYCERVLRMPDGYVCYDPPPFAPAVSSLPAQNQGFVTFGSFNNPEKITSQLIEVWAKILGRVPKSLLVLKYRGMDVVSIADELRKSFSSHRIDPSRIACLGRSPHERLLAEYHHIDLALDPFPYNGGLTTCEALWMGVPVITCPGETFASRHSLSHLSVVGLTETIAQNLGDYVELAVSLAGELPRLAALRAGLRERMACSPLCDGKRFADNLARLLRGIWQEWCQKT